MAALCAFLLIANAPGAAALDAIYLVRHAEKAEGWPEGSGIDDFWPLSPAGIERARGLARRLAEARIAAVYTSRTVRAFATGLAVAEAAGSPIVVDPDSTKPAEMNAFLARLRERHAGDHAVLVVAHSNTIPELLARLGATPGCDAALGIERTADGLSIAGYDGLWKVEPASPGCAGMKREAQAPSPTPP